MTRVAISLLLLVVSASACMCPAGAGVNREGALERINATGPKTVIFEGSVVSQELVSGPIGAPEGALSMTSRGEHRRVILRSWRVYRGPDQEQFAVATGAGGGDCGVDFETGEKYLVFADEVKAGMFFTSICSGTDWLPHSMAAVRVLRGEAPAPEDLLDYRTVYERWTGGVCGKVVNAEGQPLAHAMVNLSQVRQDNFPPERVGDPDLSKADGSFCIRTTRPGLYILSAEQTDFEASTRRIGFYPGGVRRGEAAPLTITEGKMISGVQFSVQMERLFGVRVRVVTADGSPVPRQYLRVTVSTPNYDPSEYHSTGRMGDGTALEFHYIPAGRYLFASSFDPEFGSTPKLPPEATKWRTEKREVEVADNTEVVLTLQPIK